MNEPYNASDRADVKANATAARLAQRQGDDVVRSLMRNPSGRLWLFDLLSSCHLYSSTFTGDALRSAFLEGERNTGLRLQADILRTSPDEFILMMKEAHGRDITADTTRRNRRDATRDDDSTAGINYVDYADYTARHGNVDADSNGAAEGTSEDN